MRIVFASSSRIQGAFPCVLLAGGPNTETSSLLVLPWKRSALWDTRGGWGNVGSVLSGRDGPRENLPAP